jgi:NADP-dependent 3-hydroxy acid dehydrogenase YdfG
LPRPLLPLKETEYVQTILITGASSGFGRDT